MRGVLRVYTARAEVIRSRCPLRSFSKAGAGVFSLNLPPEGGPISLVANSRARARSLRLAQRIIGSFVQALDFAAVKALIPDLKPCAEGSGRA